MESPNHIITFPRGQSSTLAQVHLRSYNLGDIKVLIKQMSTRHMIGRQVLQGKKNFPLPTGVVTVHYDPTYFGDDIKERSTIIRLIRTLFTDRPHNGVQAGNRVQALPYRANTKHRIVSSPVDCFGNSFGDIYGEAAFPFYLTTACALNFFSSDQDINDYLSHGKLDESAYKNIMKLLFKRILYAQDQAGTEIFVSPVFGGGVYLSQIINPADKERARKLIHEALMLAVEESDLQNIEEVIYAIPDFYRPEKEVEKRSDAYLSAATIFQRYKGNEKHTKLSLVNTDMLDALYHASKLGKKVGLLNPGSDRTIGGFFEQLLMKDSIKAPAEETIFNLTNAVHSQAKNYSILKFSCVEYPVSLQLSKTQNNEHSQANVSITKTKSTQ